jgi:dTDP-4-amino-4,6-dideoxygalactose transaminase
VVASGISPGDLVITTPFSFIASANCILYEKGIPVFVDVDPATGNIDSLQVERAADDIRSGGSAAEKWLPPAMAGSSIDPDRLKAILPVHVYGQPAEMDRLSEIAKRYELALVEDACEALGSEYKGRQTGTLGDMAVFAFYPNKQMTTGEGGVIVTDDPGLYRIFRSLRNQGRDETGAWLNHTRLGYNYRLDEMSAALGLAQLRRLPELIRRREQVALWYQERLENIDGVECLTIQQSTTRMSWFVYVVRLHAPHNRDLTLDGLAEKGIPSRPYFSAIHLQPYYRERFEFKLGAFPKAEALADVSLALPFSSIMTESQVDIVCSTLSDCLHNSSAVHGY